MAERNRNLVPLRESGFDVATGEPDPRGWDVFTADGRKVGEVKELIGDTTSRKVRYLDFDLDKRELGLSDKRHAFVSVDNVRLDEADKRVNLQGVSANEVIGLPATINDIMPIGEERFGATGQERTGAGWESREARLTRSEEELEINKREVETGNVELNRHVETEHVTRPVTRTHDEVEVERRRAEGIPGDEAEFRDESIRVPVHEEELEVRKHPEVKEEVIVRTHPVEEQENVEADLRRERIDVEEHGKVKERDRLDEQDRLGRGRGR